MSTTVSETLTETSASPADGAAEKPSDGGVQAALRRIDGAQLRVRAIAALPMALPLIAAFALLVATARQTLEWWLWEYGKDDSYYSHGPAIPLIIAALIWQRRDRFAAVEKRVFWPALGLVALALAVLVPASKLWMQAVMSASFLLAITGSVWFLYGTQFLRVALLPLLFLWLMAPLPGPVLNDLTFAAQQASTVGATKILELLGMHPVREGTFIAMESFRFQVDVPCSGFKLLLRLLTFSGALAALTDLTNGRKLFLFLFSLPLSIAINSFRIALFGIVGECMGHSAAEMFHDWSGIISLVLCLAILFAVAQRLGCKTFMGQRIF